MGSKDASKDPSGNFLGRVSLGNVLWRSTPCSRLLRVKNERDTRRWSNILRCVADCHSNRATTLRTTCGTCVLSVAQNQNDVTKSFLSQGAFPLWSILWKHHQVESMDTQEQFPIPKDCLQNNVSLFQKRSFWYPECCMYAFWGPPSRVGTFWKCSNSFSVLFWAG